MVLDLQCILNKSMAWVVLLSGVTFELFSLQYANKVFVIFIASIHINCGMRDVRKSERIAIMKKKVFCCFFFLWGGFCGLGVTGRPQAIYGHRYPYPALFDVC